MKTRIALLVFAASLVAACGKPADEAPAATEAPEPAAEQDAEAALEAMVEEDIVATRVDEMEMEVTATVAEIDYETRAVALTDEEGNGLFFIAGDDVERLEEISVGDKVHLKHLVTMALELRAPTEEELAEPLVILDEKLRATTTQPAGVEIRTIRAVSEIVGIDLPSQTATLQGPEGNLLTVAAEDPENLRAVSIGDTVIVTYTDAVAIAIEKAVE